MQTSHSRPSSAFRSPVLRSPISSSTSPGHALRLTAAVEQRHLVAARQRVAHLVRPGEPGAAEDQDAQRLPGARRVGGRWQSASPRRAPATPSDAALTKSRRLVIVVPSYAGCRFDGMPETPLPASFRHADDGDSATAMSLKCHETEASEGDVAATRRSTVAVVAGCSAPLESAVVAAASPQPVPAQPAATKMRLGLIGAGRLGGTIGALWVKRRPSGDVLVARSAGSAGARDQARPARARRHRRRGDRLRRRAVLRRAVRGAARARPRARRGAQGQDRARCLQRGRRARRRRSPTKWCRTASASRRRSTCPARASCAPSTRSRTWSSRARRTGADPKLPIPIAGDDAEALQVAAALVRDAGFEPVVVGGLADARRFQMGALGYGPHANAAELRQKLSLRAVTAWRRLGRLVPATPGRASCGALVVRLFLLRPRRVLRAAAAARPDGDRRRDATRCRGSSRRRSRPCCWRSRSTAPWSRGCRARASSPIVYQFFVANLVVFWLLLSLGDRAGVGGARVLRLGQRLQPVRGRRVLVVHGRPLRQRAGQAPVRLHRRRRHGRRAARPGDHDRALGAARSGQPAAGRDRLSRARAALRPAPRAQRRRRRHGPRRDERPIGGSAFAALPELVALALPARHRRLGGAAVVRRDGSLLRAGALVAAAGARPGRADARVRRASTSRSACSRWRRRCSRPASCIERFGTAVAAGALPAVYLVGFAALALQPDARRRARRSRWRSAGPTSRSPIRRARSSSPSSAARRSTRPRT